MNRGDREGDRGTDQEEMGSLIPMDSSSSFLLPLRSSRKSRGLLGGVIHDERLELPAREYCRKDSDDGEELTRESETRERERALTILLLVFIYCWLRLVNGRGTERGALHLCSSLRRDD